MTLAQVFSRTFLEIFKNIFFAEHLWTTASAIPYKRRQINTFWELAFSKYLLEELFLLILCRGFKSTWSFLRNTVFLKRGSGTVTFYELCEFSERLLMSIMSRTSVTKLWNEWEQQCSDRLTLRFNNLNIYDTALWNFKSQLHQYVKHKAKFVTCFIYHEELQTICLS